MNYKSKKWKQFRKKILRRDKYLCRECNRYGKTTGANTVHHCIPVSEDPELKYNSNNLISLCESCHEKMHDKFDNSLTAAGQRWKEKITPLVKKYL
jgi:5-methylcytosine-specific restriction endonuclease McrA